MPRKLASASLWRASSKYPFYGLRLFLTCTIPMLSSISFFLSFSFTPKKNPKTTTTTTVLTTCYIKVLNGSRTQSFDFETMKPIIPPTKYELNCTITQASFSFFSFCFSVFFYLSFLFFSGVVGQHMLTYSAQWLSSFCLSFSCFLSFYFFSPQIKRTEFYHIYDYTSFHVGPPDAIEFAQPCNMECVSTNTTWNSEVKSSISVQSSLPCSHFGDTPSSYGTNRALSATGKSSADVGLAVALFAAGVFVTLLMQNVVLKAVKGGGSGSRKYATHENPSMGGDSEL